MPAMKGVPAFWSLLNTGMPLPAPQMTKVSGAPSGLGSSMEPNTGS